ncbi:Harbinger transposase-derived nuclease [Quillaja saponaria]|uniref:Harbinger transposase-derived nuclease n=1 Tax=Quillaja saponaria TaxID=32244 RepID=A0AAD7PA41_QUISA|nr:Harbinger transposase-derived nuclease [Quillaja saponaria]
MGPVRGFKKRRKTEKKPDGNGSASGSSEKDGPVDWWDEFSKRINGLQQSPSMGIDSFEVIFKISRKTFDYICSLVKEDMLARSAHFVFTNGKPMSLCDQVAVALRRLSSGESLVAIGDLFGLNHSTVSQITWRFVESMEERGLQHLQWPSPETEMTEIKSKFKKVGGFPNCCGAIDATHIMMCLPASEPASNVWLDHEKNHSMVLQAIVDPDLRFRDIVTGWPGKMKDWLVFESSNFYKLCDKGERLNGKKLQLSEGSEAREYIIGDSGYPLLPYLLVPYEGKELPEPKAEFNKRHFATRMVAQRALARLKEMWKIIQGVMWRPDRHRLPRIIFVCCLLHNIVIDMEDEMQDELPLSHNHDSGYHQQICGSVDVNGASLRDKLSLYFTGRLPP